MIVTWTISEQGARRALELYTAILDGRGCACVQSGRATQSCSAVYVEARRDVTAIVEGNPELQARLRDAAENVLSRSPALTEPTSRSPSGVEPAR